MRKLKKIWYSFKYGNNKTKLNIITVTGVFVFSAVCLVMTVLHASSLWAMVMVFSLVLNVIIIQSLSFKSSGKSINHAEKNKKPDKSQNIKEELEDTKEDAIENITEDKIKDAMVKYKVKKEYGLVMIDFSKSMKIKETPAYMWKAGGMINFMLFEGKIRKVSIPAKGTSVIKYKPGCAANPAKEYLNFKKSSFLSSLFMPFMPIYYDDGFKRKNLYVITPDIMLTNTSAKNALKILKADVDIAEAINKNREYSQYYYDAYKLNIFWKDGVIDTKSYRSKIKALLMGMSETNMTYNEYIGQVDAMVRDKLITKEYADYYIGIMADKRLSNAGSKKKGK